MTSREIPRLDADAVWSAFEDFDPVKVVTDELRGGKPDGGGNCQLVRAASGDELVMLDDPRTEQRCLLPAPMLRTLRAATLATVAARQLLAPGVVIAGVMGADLSAQQQLSVLARHVPSVSQVALCVPREPWRVEPRLLDQLDLNGIGLLVTTDVREAVLGANLVLVPGGGPDLAGIPTRGALLVNGSGRDLARQVVEHVDEVYVDDATLLGDHEHRYFARPPGADRFGRRGGALRVEADLRGLLAGEHAGRRRADDVLLAELLSANALDAGLAWEVNRAALNRGIR